MKTNQQPPQFMKPAPCGAHIVRIPYVETSGHPSSPYEYNNGVHAALHSILAGMMCRTKKDVRYHLKTAKGQLDDAVVAINKRGSKVVPSRPGAQLREIQSLGFIRKAFLTCPVEGHDCTIVEVNGVPSAAPTHFEIVTKCKCGRWTYRVSCREV